MSRQYEEVEVLRDPDGVAIVITKRIDAPFHSFAIVKEFERDGQVIRTNFLARRHAAGIRRLLTKLEAWIDQEVDRAAAPRAARPAR